MDEMTDLLYMIVYFLHDCTTSFSSFTHALSPSLPLISLPPFLSISLSVSLPLSPPPTHPPKKQYNKLRKEQSKK